MPFNECDGLDKKKSSCFTTVGLCLENNAHAEKEDENTLLFFPEMFVTPKSRKTPEGIKQLQKQENTQPQKKNGKKKKENPANALSRARHDCFLFFFCDRQQQRKFALVWPPKWRT